MMQATKRVTQLGLDNIGDVLQEQNQPLFIACLRKDKDFHEDLMHLQDLATFFGDTLRVCFHLDELLAYFAGRYGVSGTPTFLIIVNGELRGILLGRNQAQALIEFTLENLPDRREEAVPGKKPDAAVIRRGFRGLQRDRKRNS